LSSPSKEQARSIIKALRVGTVPEDGLEHYAVGLDREMHELNRQLDFAQKGNGELKFIRGAYGSGKTFLTSLVSAEALKRNFVVSKVVISQSDTPMHKFEVVYRKICQNMRLPGDRVNALASVLDRWFYSLEEQVTDIDGLDEDDPGFLEAISQRVDSHLHAVADKSGRFAACIKAYHRLQFHEDFIKSRGILDWMCGDTNVAAGIKREAGVKGDLARNDVFTFLRGMLELFRRAGHPGLLLVLDEAETIRHKSYRSDLRSKALELLREMVDKVSDNNLPGLVLMVTGTPELFESPLGIPALEPLHQRITVEFDEDPSTDNLRQPQIRLRSFDLDRLKEVAHKIRDIYPADNPERLIKRVDADFLDHMLEKFQDGFGESLGVTPRLFLRALIDILDRVDQHEHFDPYQHNALSEARFASLELSSEELSALQELKS
jgi:hypothetical protein